MIGSPDDAIYLAKEGEEHIAFIHTSIRRDYVEGADEMPVAYVEAIYVKPAFQKRGIARDLISAAEKWAMQKGLKQIGSDTDTTNPPSIEFHKAVGFTEVERIVCFIKNLE
jgi:aminoglycoside 6'-N-acetyltransferase I